LYEALGKKSGAIIARFGVGHDSVNKPLARQHSIVVTNTPGVLDVSVAEHALWLMGCLARKISRLEARLRAGEFAGEVGMELRGKTLGVLGFDPATRCMRIEATHPGVSADTIRANTGFELGQAERVETTEPPSDDELLMLRALDPERRFLG